MANKSGYLVHSDNKYYLIRDSKLKKGNLAFDQRSEKIVSYDPEDITTDPIKVVLEEINFPNSLKEGIISGTFKIDDFINIE